METFPLLHFDLSKFVLSFLSFRIDSIITVLYHRVDYLMRLLINKFMYLFTKPRIYFQMHGFLGTNSITLVLDVVVVE